MSTLATAAVCAAIFLLLERPSYRLLDSMRHARFVRAYLFDPKVRRLAQALRQGDPRTNLFKTMWDTNAGVMLSRQMFREVDMDGVPRYEYKPNLRKLSFVTGADGLQWRIQTIDTAPLRQALAGLDTTVLVTAAYDGNGFRRVASQLSADCQAHVLFLGDSFTDGVWVADEETFVSLYGEMARTRAGANVCPVNAGVNGYGTLEERFAFEHDFDRAGRPSIVFVMFFANDVDVDFEAVVRGTMPNETQLWQANLNELHAMHEFAQAHGTTLVLVAIPTREQVVDRSTRAHYQDVLRAFAGREGIRFIDLYDGLAAHDPRPLYWSWDPHFTPAGHRAVAGLLFEATKDLLHD